MNIHPLVASVAYDLAQLKKVSDWKECVPDAEQALRSVAAWTDDQHRAARVDLKSTDCYITVSYLRSAADGADPAECRPAQKSETRVPGLRYASW